MPDFIKSLLLIPAICLFGLSVALVASLAVLVLPVVLVPVTVWRVLTDVGRGQGVTEMHRAQCREALRSSGPPHPPSPLI